MKIEQAIKEAKNGTLFKNINGETLFWKTDKFFIRTKSGINLEKSTYALYKDYNDYEWVPFNEIIENIPNEKLKLL